MKIVRIFDNCLFAVSYDNEPTDEFDRLFDLWQDTQYLFNFFTDNLNDLQSGFWGTISIDEAIIRTIKDAQYFEKLFLKLSGQTILRQNNGLDSLFVPLDNLQTQIKDLNKSKARQSWLRIYALRVERNIYIVTGGAIKLTARMKERPHTKEELKKLEKCRNFLLEHGIIETDGVIEELEI